MIAWMFALLFFLPFQPEVADVEWISPQTHDFGDLKINIPATHEFRFKNVSNRALTIDNVRATCGCTASEWSDELVEPGGEGHIEIEYDARKEGYFQKKITVYFSGQRKGEKLIIEGYVE